MIDKILCFDWETTGLPITDRPFRYFEEGPQGIEIGAHVVTDLYSPDGWKIQDQFHSKIQWLGDFHGEPGEYPDLTWSEYSATFHGNSIESLMDAPHPKVAGEHFIEFLNDNFDLNTRIPVFAFNPAFDIYFSRQFLWFCCKEVSSEIRFHHRMLDAFTAAFVLEGLETSDEVFKEMTHVERNDHSALEDSELTVKSMREMIRRRGGIPR